MGIETDLPVPAVDGKITLGTWQELILIDFDKRPRKRNIVERWSGLFGQAEAIYK
jgi:thiamine phosphate synthase YjbQ (UPF0047 family)